MEKSRRTIILLTPSYIQSGWTQFEYAVAHHRMVEKKIKIIPIIFQDISNVTNIQQGLSHLLRTITYIEWPGSDNHKNLSEFWERLRLSMPKKRSSSIASLTDSQFPRLSRFQNFREPSSSSEVTPFSTPNSERRSYMSSRQASIRSTLSAMSIYLNGSFRNSYKDTIFDVKGQVKPTGNDPLRSEKNSETLIPMPNIETRTSESATEATQAYQNEQEPDENHEAGQEPNDVAGSSMRLLGPKASGPGKLKIARLDVIIEGSSSPPTDITYCSFGQNNITAL